MESAHLSSLGRITCLKIAFAFGNTFLGVFQSRWMSFWFALINLAFWSFRICFAWILILLCTGFFLRLRSWSALGIFASRFTLVLLRTIRTSNQSWFFFLRFRDALWSWFCIRFAFACRSWNTLGTSWSFSLFFLRFALAVVAFASAFVKTRLFRARSSNKFRPLINGFSHCIGLSGFFLRLMSLILLGGFIILHEVMTFLESWFHGLRALYSALQFLGLRLCLLFIRFLL